MSKKDDLANDLSRGRKRNLKKTIDTTEAKAKEIVEKIAPAESPQPEQVAEKLVRTTMDLPKSIHRAIKMKSASDEISLKDYIISLVKKDLNLD